MRTANLAQWTGKVTAILGPRYQTPSADAEDFASEIEDEVDEVSQALLDQVWGETGAHE